jgi:hypothetical protein
MTTCTNNDRDDELHFESRFESGNLAKAVKITNTYYELYLRTDLYTNRHMQWFYFRVTNTKKHIIYRFLSALSYDRSVYAIIFSFVLQIFNCKFIKRREFIQRRHASAVILGEGRSIAFDRMAEMRR